MEEYLNIRKIPGRKWRKDYINNLILPHIPNHIDIYVEPFAGSFNVSTFLNRPKTLVYNDINIYSGIYDLDVDHIEHLDYKECIKKWDSDNTFFYIDPPYYKKENWYKGSVSSEDFHIELKEVLDNTQGKWILSYESDPFIEKLYRGYNIYDYTGSSSYIKDIIILKNEKY